MFGLLALGVTEIVLFVEWIAVQHVMESHKKKEDTAYATSSFFIDKLNLLNTDLQ